MTKQIYHGPPTEWIHLAMADGASLGDAFEKNRFERFKLCDADSSELVIPSRQTAL